VLQRLLLSLHESSKLAENGSHAPSLLKGSSPCHAFPHQKYSQEESTPASLLTAVHKEEDFCSEGEDSEEVDGDQLARRGEGLPGEVGCHNAAAERAEDAAAVCACMGGRGIRGVRRGGQEFMHGLPRNLSGSR
jgi:hypothetical protein